MLSRREADDGAVGNVSSTAPVTIGRTGDASKTDTAELIAYVRKLQAQVLAWLQDKHPILAPRR